MRAPLRIGLPAVALAAAGLLAAAVAAGAQTIAVQVGDSARLQVAPGARVGIPLRVDLANAGSTLNLASLSGTLTWGSARLTFDSIRVNAATGFTQTANTAGAATGSAVLSYFSTARLEATAALATAWFTASGTAGGTRVAFAPSDAGSEAGRKILTQLVTRALDVCVGSSSGGRWGDVNDDGGVSIIDAQQIARSSVGLSVANAAAVAARGDVNADGSVSIIDAQQIARFSVGLSAAARINTTLAAAPTVATLALSPSGAQQLAVGGTLTLAATPRDAANADLTGCATVTFASSAASVATVSTSGVVTGVAAGTATITATSGAATATLAITVGSSGSCPATPIALGDSVSGTLATSDCASPRLTGSVEDRYSFTTATATAVTLRLRSTAFDAYLQVRNASGQVVFENDDESTGATNSLLNVTLDAGSYTIAAGSFRSGETGAYTLSVRSGGTTPGTCTTTPIALGDSLAGTLAATDCASQRIAGGFEDRYSFTAAASTVARLRLRSTAFDTYLQVRNAAGQVVFENNNESGTSTNSALDVTLAAGSYTIIAGSLEAARTGAYTLAFRPGGTDTPGCTTRPIALGDSVAGTLAATDCASQRVTGGYEDRFSFTAAASTVVQLRLRSTAFDAFLQVRNATGQVVFENDDESTSSRNSALDVTLAAGSYTITAGSYDPGSTGAYALTFRQPQPPPGLAYTATGGASIVTLEPGATATTTVTVRDNAGNVVTPAITYTVRDDSVARVVTGGVQARSRSGVTPGTFVVAEARTLSPVPADSIYVLVPRTSTGPVIRTDLASYRISTTAGTAVTFNVLIDMRNAAHLGAADFDLVIPTSLFFGAVGSSAPVVTPAAGVVARVQGLSNEVARISFSYARPALPGPTNDGVIQIAQVTLKSRGGAGASFPFGTLTLIPGSIFSTTLQDLLSTTTAYSYPVVVRAP